MFTGLVEGCGSVEQIVQEAAGIRLTVSVRGTPLESATADGCGFGDSVAINGCCLTVVEHDGSTLAFQAGSETLSKTNLGRLQPSDPVNLERSLPVNGRLGGHFVQGHVDGIGKVADIRSEPAADGTEWIFMTFRVAEELARLMVPKGSVAVDGVSLTIVDVEVDHFRVALIPHTLHKTTLGRRAVGDVVNIETDILGKYVAKLLGQPDTT